MADPVVLDSARLPDGSGWSLQRSGGSGKVSYRYYFFGPGELDDDYIENYELRWVDFELDDDFADRFDLDAVALDEMSDALGISAGRLSRSAASSDPRERGRFLREYINFQGDDAVDDSPEIVDYEGMLRQFPHLFGGAAAVAPDVSGELDEINAHRRAIGMRPLDPAAAGWSDDDIVAEARRLRGNPRRRNPREELLAW